MPLRLADFRDCIAAMPVQHQAFSSKRSTWKRLESHPDIGPAIRNLFPRTGDIRISRADLFHYAGEEDLTRFIFATITWGYPRGMRGFNLQKVISGYRRLLAVLLAARSKSVADWKEHTSASRVEGVGLSTYTKLLYFLRVRIAGFHALILDDRLIQVGRNQYFSELAPLARIGAHNAVQRYPAYLSCIHEAAGRLKVNSDSLEMFLFEFGLNLKQPAR